MKKGSIKLFVFAVLAVATISFSSCKKKEEAPAPDKGKDTTVVDDSTVVDETAKIKALAILKSEFWTAKSITGPAIGIDGVTGLVTALGFDDDNATVYKSGDLDNTTGGQSEKVSYALSNDASTITIGTVDYAISDLTEKSFTLTDKAGNVYKFVVADVS